MIADLGRGISKVAMYGLNYSRWAEVPQLFFIGLLFYFSQFPSPPEYAAA